MLWRLIWRVLIFFLHREQDMRNSILAQVLEQSARARCKCFSSKSFLNLSVIPYLKYNLLEWYFNIFLKDRQKKWKLVLHFKNDHALYIL